MAKMQTNHGEHPALVRQNDMVYQPFRWGKQCLSPKYLLIHSFIAAIVALSVLVTLFHVQVIQILQPFTDVIQDLSVGFLIPGAIAFAISFPPLFGHEIIAILCGAAYGLYIGFAIMAAGTLLGEVGTWFAFKRLFRRRISKLEHTNLGYGSMARMARDGGFWIVLIIRYSIVPSHFSTAFLATCSIPFWQFALAAVLTLPRQLVLVYLGVLPAWAASSLRSRNFTLMRDKDQAAAAGNVIDAHISMDDSVIIQLAVLGVAVLVTIGLAAFVWFKMRRMRDVLLEEQHRRKVLNAVAPAAGGVGTATAGGARRRWRRTGFGCGSGDSSSSSRSRERSTASHSSGMHSDDLCGRRDSFSGRPGVVGLGYSVDARGDHASLIGGLSRALSQTQRRRLEDDRDAKEQQTRGRPRTRRGDLSQVHQLQHPIFRGQQQQKGTPPPPDYYFCYPHPSKQQQKHSSKQGFYLQEHELTVLPPSSQQQQKQQQQQQKKQGPTTPPSPLLPPPSFSFLPVIRPSSPASMAFGIPSFSRPRPRTLSVGSGSIANSISGVGHAYHNRFHSEDSTTTGGAAALAASAPLMTLQQQQQQQQTGIAISTTPPPPLPQFAAPATAPVQQHAQWTTTSRLQAMPQHVRRLS